jgi:hypothetical protein
MKQMVGLKNYGSLMMRSDHRIAFDWLMESGWDNVSFVAAGRISDRFYSIINLGIDYHCYDMDPVIVRDDYTLCDVIFDPITLSKNIINFNAQKMYPLGKVHKGEFIIIGSSDRHPGDCNIVTSCKQLIEQNEIHTVIKAIDIPNYSIVWGRND